MPLPKLLNETETATYLGIDAITLARLRENGNGPAFITIDPPNHSLIRYRETDLSAWIEAIPAIRKTKIRITK